MQPMLNIALRAARSAGELILRSTERLDVISVNEKDAKDYVTEIDRAAPGVYVYLSRIDVHSAVVSSKLLAAVPGLREQTGPEQWRFILAGTSLIAISLAATVAADGTQFGVLLWLCQAGMLGVALICCLPFARTAVTASAFVAALLAPLSLAAASWM